MTIPNISIKQWLPLALIATGLLIIAPQLKVFRASLTQLRSVSYEYVLLAITAVALTFILGALVYLMLAWKPLDYRRTLIAQLAANFVNRLLPAGIGGIGANYRYLRKQRHTGTQAASVVTANNGLGLVGHGLLIIVLISLFGAKTEPIQLRPAAIAGLLVGIIAVVVLLTAQPKVRRSIRRRLKHFGEQLRGYRRRPQDIGRALLLQVCLTLCNVTAFWLSILAVDAHLGFVPALLVFTLGFGVGGAVPTPGGLGGIEAGLIAGLVAYHIASPTALAAVLVFRLVSYWLPLIISGGVFLYASKRHYF